ncbi:glycine zipper 2TM domain-containing protein [Parachitinimonas caeni]|uniref:Glycine zipper 2TM domain-containing protein n=1 Tax=Parachitinimonas caeni TaxID=3031301 RepID=A0ABT7DWM5_9NEIS|nr:glycine zipper 2TM domain-containing protein [Parachitinimonas caeni]MDK2124224.1 glycine zipper 2TM domain-containing protein [Parachitinimonas caeni]
MMNKSMLIGMIAGGVAVVSVGAAAGYKALKGPEFADVVSVDPVKVAQKQPHQECRQVKVTHVRPVKDSDRITGTVIGGLLGGALGNQVGGGDGRKLATVAGIVGGGYAGNRIQKSMQDSDRYTTTEERCKTINETVEKVVGYDVKYRLDGNVGMVRMDHLPADRIPVKDGQLVLNQYTPVQHLN